MENINKQVQKLKNKLCLILNAKFTFPPYIFLMAVSFKILYPELFILLSTKMLMLFCLAFTFVTGQSYYYLLGPFMNNQFLPLTALNLAIGLITANQKWKLYFYVLSIAQYTNMCQNNQISHVFVLICAYTTKEFYENLIVSRQHNQICFIILSLLTMLSIILIVLKALYLESYFTYLVVISIALFSKLFKQIYESRIQKLTFSKIEQIKSPYIAFAYIQEYQYRLKVARYRFSLISQHKFECHYPLCACKKQQINQKNEDFDNILLQNLFQNFLNSPNHRNKEYLLHKFIHFKIRQGKYIEAIRMLQSLKNTPAKNIFIFIQRLRSQDALKSRLLDLDQTLCRKNIYIEGLQYDQHVSDMVRKVQELVWLKIAFLKQIGKQTSRLVEIEKIGLSIIQKIQYLHTFFQQKILKFEQKLNCCSATIIYSFYLICITNSTDYVRMLIKDTKESFEQSQSSNQEKYEIQTILIQNVNNQTAYRNNQTQIVTPEVKSSTIIKNVSQSFCRLARKTKKQIVGKHIQNFIPPVYRKDHDQLVKNVFHGIYDSSSKLISNRRLYPVYLGQNQTALITINLKIIIQHNGKLAFVALLQPIPRKHKLILTNFNLENLSSEPLCDYQILKSTSLKMEIQKNKQQWMALSVFKTNQFILDFHDQRFSVKISSPSQHRFLEVKQDLPIHLEVKNQIENDPTKAENYIKIINDIEIRRYLGKIEQQITPQMSSQETNGSKKIALNYLRGLHKIKTFSFFKLLYIFVIALFIVGVSFSAILCHTLRLTIISNNNENSLLDSLQTLQTIRISFTQVLSFSFDIYAKTQNALTQYQIERSYGKVNLTSFVQSLLKQKYEDLNEAISFKLSQFEGQAKQISHKIFQNKFQILQFQDKINYTLYGTLKNCLIDVRLLVKSDYTNFNETILRKHYLNLLQPKIQRYINQTNQLIQNKAKLTIFGNMLMSISFALILLTLLIPFYIFFKKYSKHRIDFYDILLSVEGKYIKSQIETLLRLHNFIQQKRSYRQRKQISKQSLFTNQCEVNLESSNCFIDNEMYINNQLRSQAQSIKIRKKIGQLSLQGSSEKKYNIISIKCLVIILVLFLGLSMIIIGALKLYFSLKTIALQQRAFQDQVLDYKRYESLLNLKDLASKIFIQNAPLQQVHKQYQISKQETQQIQNITKDYLFDQTIVPCKQSMQTLSICKQKYSQSALTLLLLATEKEVLSLYETNQLEEGGGFLLNFGSTILIQFQQIGKLKSLKRSQKARWMLKQEDNWIMILQIVLYLECLILFISCCFLCYQAIYIYLKQIQFFLLLTKEAIENNKRIQCFMQKISKY